MYRAVCICGGAETIDFLPQIFWKPRRESTLPAHKLLTLPELAEPTQRVKRLEEETEAVLISPFVKIARRWVASHRSSAYNASSYLDLRQV